MRHEQKYALILKDRKYSERTAKPAAHTQIAEAQRTQQAGIFPEDKRAVETTGNYLQHWQQ